MMGFHKSGVPVIITILLVVKGPRKAYFIAVALLPKSGFDSTKLWLYYLTAALKCYH